MKKLNTLICLFIAIQSLHSQEIATDNELAIQTTGGLSNSSVRFELIPLSTVICFNDFDCTFENQVIPTYSSVLVGEEVICSYNGFSYRWCNVPNNTIHGPCSTPLSGVKPLKWAFYKINIYLNDVLKKYIYYDNRDGGFPRGSCGENCSGNDITLRYKIDTDVLQFFNYHRGSSGGIPTKILSSGYYLNIMEEKNCTPRDFSPFWSEGLVLVPSVNNRPKLIWGPYSDSFVLLYQILRDESGFGNFTPIGTVNNSTFTYTDNTVVISEPGQMIYYKVKAIGPNSFTNTVNTSIIPFKINSGSGTSEVFKFALGQNYPNPFNPTTSISFSIESKGKVLLKVFDVLGNEIETLVDSEYEPGLYEVKFNGSNLPSGVYFYSILTNDFMQTNKMILAK